MAKINEVERRILDGMTGADQLKALMREAGYETYRDFARYLGRYIEEVSMCLQGRRRYDDIRDALAERLGLTREQVDQLIDGSAPKPAEVAS